MPAYLLTSIHNLLGSHTKAFCGGCYIERDLIAESSRFERVYARAQAQDYEPSFFHGIEWHLVMLRVSVFNHLAHHRGQLTVYSRLNEASVPAIDGPSADQGRFE